MKSFEDNHVRLLRETLSGIANHAPDPTTRKRALNALKAFAEFVKDYCPHPDSVSLAGGLVKKCLSCGHTFEGEAS